MAASAGPEVPVLRACALSKTYGSGDSAVHALRAVGGVYRVVDGRARLTPVDLGGRNGNEAWVRSGLRTADTVIVYPPPSVSDGQRVQPRRR